jgi:hypothetical protein
VLVVEEQRQLTVIFMSRVEDRRPSPPTLLVDGQFPELGHDPLPWTTLGSPRLDEREGGVSLPVLGAMVCSQKHPCLPASQHATESEKSKRVGLHYTALANPDYAWRHRQRGFTLDGSPKIASIFSKLRNLG